MACEILTLDDAVFALWGKPNKADLDRVLATVEQAADSLGRPVLYIARIPKDAPAPEGEVRAHMNALMPRFVKSCAGYHALLEGSGFVSAVKRAVLAGLLQFGFPNGTFFVHDTPKRILAKAQPSQRPSLEAILALATRKGLL
jgi:hypothetical protein